MGPPKLDVSFSGTSILQDLYCLCICPFLETNKMPQEIVFDVHTTNTQECWWAFFGQNYKPDSTGSGNACSRGMFAARTNIMWDCKKGKQRVQGQPGWRGQRGNNIGGRNGRMSCYLKDMEGSYEKTNHKRTAKRKRRHLCTILHGLR